MNDWPSPSVNGNRVTTRGACDGMRNTVAALASTPATIAESTTGIAAPPQGLRRREGGHAPGVCSCERGGIVQHDPRFADVAQPLPDVPIETPRDQTPHRRGRRCGERRPVDVLAQDRRERVGNIVALERALARQHLVEHRAERPHVAPLVSLASLRLLGTHVRGGAKDDAHLRHRGARDRRRRRHVCRL